MVIFRQSTHHKRRDLQLPTFKMFALLIILTGKERVVEQKSRTAMRIVSDLFSNQEEAVAGVELPIIVAQIRSNGRVEDGWRVARVCRACDNF